LRGWNSDVIALSRDEPFTIYFSQLSLSEFVPIVLETNNPPTFEILIHFWSKLFGHDITTLRWLPIIIVSLGSIPMYFLGKRLKGNHGAFAVSILYLGSSLLMNLSHLARAYCLLITGSIFMFYLFLLVIEKQRRIHVILWTLACVITCYSHYFGWVVVATIWAAILFNPEFRIVLWKRFAKATFFLIITYLPLSLYLFNRFAITRNDVSSFYQAPVANRFTSLIGEYLNADFVPVFLAFLGIGLSGILIFRKKLLMGIVALGVSTFIILSYWSSLFGLADSYNQIKVSVLILFTSISLFTICVSKLSPTIKLICFWILVPLVGGFFISIRFPIFVDRYFSFTLPGLLLVIVLIIGEIPIFNLRLTAFGILLVFYFFNFRSEPEYYVDHREAVDSFKILHNSSDLSIVGPDYFDFDFVYYFNKDIFYNGQNHFADTVGEKISSDASYVRYKEGLRRELLRNQIVVTHDSSTLKIDTSTIQSIALFDGNLSLAYPQNGLYEFLQSQYGPPIESKDYSGIYKIHLFKK
jgi:hypothetical protein